MLSAVVRIALALEILLVCIEGAMPASRGFLPLGGSHLAVLGALLHGKERRVYGDQAYRGQRAAIRQHAPNARDFTNQRYRYRGVVDEVARGKNRTKSSGSITVTLLLKERSRR